MQLLDLYYDVLIQILEDVEPEDLAALAQTSWAFNRFVKDNTSLYKAQYLKHFDDPRIAAHDADPAWIPSLQRLVKCRKIIQSESEEIKTASLDFVLSTVDHLISTASSDHGDSRNQHQLGKLFSTPQSADHFLYKSTLFSYAGTDAQASAPTPEARLLSAKIHCFHGIPSTATGRRVLSTHAYARSRVYDLRNYNRLNRFGPFLSDGSMRVNWELLECVMILVGYNNTLCSRRLVNLFAVPWSTPFGGVFPQTAQLDTAFTPSIPVNPSLSLDMQDPYGVSGIWARILCFLDYDDLYHFNFSPVASRTPAGRPLPPLTTDEAIRHLFMRLTVTNITEPGKLDKKDMPVVHFRGEVRAVDTNVDANARSRFDGVVRMTEEGEVRWSSVWIFNGHEERWRSEAIQVGGLRSERGVVGVWYDKSFDDHGPAGPTAFWKIRDLSGAEEEEGDIDRWADC